MNEFKHNPKRRWFQFSLRTLLIVFTLVAGPLGWVGWQYQRTRRERAAVLSISRLGGDVYYQKTSATSEWRRWIHWQFRARVQSVALCGPEDKTLLPLTEFRNLEYLGFYRGSVRDLTPLTQLTRLRALNFEGSQVSDLSPLAGMKDLERLQLHETQVADLMPLAGLKKLKQLDFSNTRVCDLSPLAHLENLETLGLDNTNVRDLSALAGLKHLNSLWLDNTQVSAAEVEKLQAALPNCNIYYSPKEMEPGEDSNHKELAP